MLSPTVQPFPYMGYEHNVFAVVRNPYKRAVSEYYDDDTPARLIRNASAAALWGGASSPLGNDTAPHQRSSITAQHAVMRDAEEDHRVNHLPLTWHPPPGPRWNKLLALEKYSARRRGAAFPTPRNKYVAS